MAFVRKARESFDVSSFTLQQDHIFALAHRATRMAPDPMTDFLNKGYVEARALYEDDKFGEAIEKAVQLLEEEGIAQASTNEDFLLAAARSFRISSHQMAHDDRGMRGRLERCRQSSDQVRGPLVDGAPTGHSSRYSYSFLLHYNSALASCNRPRDGNRACLSRVARRDRFAEGTARYRASG